MSLLAVASDDVALQALQIFGALCVLAGFTAAQLGTMTPQSLVYLLLNFVGSSVLAALAAADQQYGFLLLEGAWAVVSAWALYRYYEKRGRTSRA